MSKEEEGIIWESEPVGDVTPSAPALAGPVASAPDANGIAWDAQPDQGKVTDFITRPFKAQGALAIGAFSRGVGSFSKNLDELAMYVGEKLGVEDRSGAFATAARIWLDNADYWDSVAKKVGTTAVDQVIGEAVGGAVPGMAEFMMGVPYAAVSGAKDAAKQGESELKGAAYKGVHRYLLGKALGATEPLTRPLKAGAMGATFAADTAGQGGSMQDIAKSAGTGALYGLTGRSGPIGAKQVMRGILPKPKPAPKPTVEQAWTGKDTLGTNLAASEMTPEEMLPFRKKGQRTGTEALRMMDLQGKYVDSINIDKVGGGKDVVDLIAKVSNKYKDVIDEARGLKATQEVADLAGVTVDRLINRKTGEAWNAAEIQAARDIMVSEGLRLAKLQEAIRKEQHIDDVHAKTVVDINDAIKRFAMIQASVAGLATESSRALSSHKVKSGEIKGYEAAVDALGGRELQGELLKRFSQIDFTNPVEVTQFIRGVSKAKTADMVYEAYINAMLSAFPTHASNVISNSLTLALRTPESVLGSGVDAARAFLTGKPRERFFGESWHEAAGIRQGLKEGVTKALWSFRNEMSTEGASKIETSSRTAIPSKELNILGKKIEVGGKQVRIPGRMLMAADEFFKAVNYSMSINGLAYRMAAKEGLKGDALANRIVELKQNPTAEMQKTAKTDMLYRVFQQEMGPAGKAMGRIRTAFPGGRYLIPFLRTPINIAKYGLERTPLNLARLAYKRGKGEIKGGQLAEEIGRSLMGSMIGATMVMLAKDGTVTGGGPSKPSERETLYRLGWQPYSIKVGDQYYSYNRLEPIGMVAGLAADAAEIWDKMDDEDREDMATLITHAIAKNLLSKTWTKGVADFLVAALYPERGLNSWTERMAGSLIPASFAALERAIDPEMRDAQTIIEYMKSRVPGLSEDLPPRLNLWGEPIRVEGSAAERFASPIYRSSVKGNKIDQEMQRLGLHVGLPARKLGGEKLTTLQYHDYVKESGQMAKEMLLKSVNHKGWDKMSDDAKRQSIKRTIINSRKVVAMRMKMKAISDKEAEGE